MAMASAHPAISPNTADASEHGLRESLPTLLQHTALQPLFIAPRAWTHVHLRLLKCAFGPAAVAPAGRDIAPVFPMKKEEFWRYERARKAVEGYQQDENVMDILTRLGYTYRRRAPPSLYALNTPLATFLRPSFLIHSMIDTVMMPRQSRPAFMRTDIRYLQAAREGIYEKYWSAESKRLKGVKRVMTVPPAALKRAHLENLEAHLDDPYIAVMLVAVAQARLRKEARDTIILGQVVSACDSEYIHIYTAAVPRALLYWLNPTPSNDREEGNNEPFGHRVSRVRKRLRDKRAKYRPSSLPPFVTLPDCPRLVPDWPTWSIARLDVPYKPYSDFHQRLDGAIRSERIRIRQGETISARLQHQLPTPGVSPPPISVTSATASAAPAPAPASALTFAPTPSPSPKARSPPLKLPRRAYSLDDPDAPCEPFTLGPFEEDPDTLMT